MCVSSGDETCNFTLVLWCAPIVFDKIADMPTAHHLSEVDKGLVLKGRPKHTMPGTLNMTKAFDHCLVMMGL